MALNINDLHGNFEFSKFAESQSRDCKVITITWSQPRFVKEDEGVKVYYYPKMEELLNEFLNQGYEVKQILHGGNLCYLEVYLERIC